MTRCRLQMLPVLLAILLVGCGREQAPKQAGTVVPAPAVEPEETPEVAEPPFVVTRAHHEGLEVVTVENAKIRVAFLPAVGGRLWQYALKRSGNNQLWNNPAFPDPDDVERWHNYGGLDDHLDFRGGTTSPQKLPTEPYVCEVAESDDNVTVTLVYENPWYRLERTHVVFPNSTRLHTREVVTNLDDAPRKLAPRPHPVFAVGGDADNLDDADDASLVDTFFQSTPGGALVQRYAKPLHRDITAPNRGRWAGAIDPAKHEAVVMTFDPGEVDEINLWFAESSYNVEPVALPRPLEKNQSAAMSFDLFILSDDNLAAEARALPVDEDTAEGIAEVLDAFMNNRETIERIDRERFTLTPWGYTWASLPPVMTAGDEPVSLRVWAGAFDAKPAKLHAAVDVVGRSDDKTLPSPVARVSVAGAEREDEAEDRWVYLPGEAHKVWEFPIQVDKLKDDVYELTLAVGPGEGRARLTQDLIVARELRAKIEAAGKKEKTKSRPRYAAAKFYLGYAEYSGAVGDRSIPAGKPTYATVERHLAHARERLDGKYTEPTSGRFARFYTSDIDDSAQGYHVQLPEGYTKKKKWPVVVYLHGRRPGDPPFDPEYAEARFDAFVKHAKVILVGPHGRGNLGYRGAGADDVLRVMEIVKRDYSVDADRVYLTGRSMGGGGTWRLATRYPDVFAGVAPLYGFVSPWLGRRKRADTPPWLQYRLDAGLPAESLGNLLNTPVYLYHGVKDVTIDVEQSRFAAKRLRELKHPDFVYEEDPDGIHFIPKGLLERIGDFFLEHKLERNAKHVRLRTPYLRYAVNRWVEIDACDRQMKFMEVDAQIKDDVVTVDLENVTAFTLKLNKDLVDLKKPVAVNVARDTTFWIEKPGSGTLSFVLKPSAKTVKPRWSRGKPPTSRPNALLKTRSVEGPISDALRRRFILVVGTAGSDEWDAAARALARRFNEAAWKYSQHVDCLVRTDAELTPDEKKNANLILIGRPDLNVAAKEAASKLPVRFEKTGGFTIDGRTFKQPQAALAMVYPNVRAPKRCVVLVTANSPRALEGMFEYRNRSRFFGLDYCVYLDAGDADPRVLLSGVFDRHWKFDRETQWAEEKTP